MQIKILLMVYGKTITNNMERIHFEMETSLLDSLNTINHILAKCNTIQEIYMKVILAMV